MAGGIGAASFVVAPESTTSLTATVGALSVTTFAAGVTGRPLWPSDITGLVLWLPADQIQGIASGASLSAWTDSSTSLAHATQASAASQPIFVTNVQNGLSAVSFGAAISQFLTSQTSSLDTSSFAVVVQSSANTTATQKIIGSTAATLRLVTTGGNYAILTATATTDGAVIATWKTITVVASGSSSTIVVSGVTTVGSTGTSAGGSSINVVIGATTASAQTFSGYMGEIIAFNRGLFEIERSSIESYLRTKWAI